jgi:hypothetical protein
MINLVIVIFLPSSNSLLFVLHFRATGRLLVDEDGLDRRRRMDVIEPAEAVGERIADEVVEVENAGVIVPVLQPERCGQAVQ